VTSFGRYFFFRGTFLPFLRALENVQLDLRVPSRLRNLPRPRRVASGVVESVYEGAAFPPPSPIRSGCHGSIAFADADEDDNQIETWMIGQGQELSGNRHAVARKSWSRF
jgi:hypothetical protein